MTSPPAGRARKLADQQRVERGLSEMIGLVRGVIADGTVSADEAGRLAAWTREHPEIAARWPANLLARRLDQIFRDGRVDSKERRQLGALLGQLAENPAGLGSGFAPATDLPISRPEPEVVFEGSTFVFAGELAFGPIRACEREVEELGGRCERAVSRRTDFVVIGGLSALEWCQSGFGEVMDEVVQHRARGAEISVISEDHWAMAVP
jgi:hypothetical protein